MTSTVCAECGQVDEDPVVAECSRCGSRQVRRAVRPASRLLWSPWDSEGKRIPGLRVEVEVVDSRVRARGGHLDVLCRPVSGCGERWFDLRGLDPVG